MEIVACSADKIQKTSLYSSKAGDNMLFMHVIIWLLMQFKALIIPIICILLYFKSISIIYTLFHD